MRTAIKADFLSSKSFLPKAIVNKGITRDFRSLFVTYAKKAYYLAMELTDIYNAGSIKDAARLKLARWFNKVEKLGVDNFYTVIDTFKNHYDSILNFFVNRATNANAESFNAKVKAFRAQFRGVTDIPFFLYRLMKLCA